MYSYEDFKPYQGNPLLKRAGEKFEWTQEQLQEFVKCSTDPIYFAEKYMKIVHVDHGLMTIALFPYQKEMIMSMHENRNSIFATARQAGKSTVVCAYLLWYIIFNNNKTVALLANKGETAREILGRIQLAYQHLPKWLQQGVFEWNKGTCSLENGSRILAAATSADAIRGYSINFLFIDEAAHIENWEAFFTSVFPTISSGKTTKIVLVSTPLGLNHFYKTYRGAMLEPDHKDYNGYNAITVRWNDVPGRDEKWKNLVLAGMDFNAEKFAQEHEVEFLGSSGTLIAGWKLKEMFAERVLREHDGLKQYYQPNPARRYALIADVSRGRGMDYSAFSVIDTTEMPYVQVAAYRNNLILATDYADVIHNVAKLYNDALVLVETNDIGEQICDLLYYDYEYVNLVQTENNGSQGKRISQGFSGKTTDRGIRTTVRVKNIGCSLLKMLIEQNQLILTDENTIDELKTFSRKNKTYEAEPGKHDDLAMGLVLFAWMTDQGFFKEVTDINTLNQLREKSEAQIYNELVPFGFIDDGQDVHEAEPNVITIGDFDYPLDF